MPNQDVCCQERGGGNHQNAKLSLMSLIADPANRVSLFLVPADFDWLCRLDRLSPLRAYRPEPCLRIVPRKSRDQISRGWIPVLFRDPEYPEATSSLKLRIYRSYVVLPAVLPQRSGCLIRYRPWLFLYLDIA